VVVFHIDFQRFLNLPWILTIRSIQLMVVHRIPKKKIVHVKKVTVKPAPRPRKKTGRVAAGSQLTYVRPSRPMVSSAEREPLRETEFHSTIHIPVITEGTLWPSIVEIDLNPLAIGLPILKSKAAYYDKHRLNSVDLVYEPMCAATQAGQLVMSYDSDINDPIPSGTNETMRRDLCSNPGAVRIPVSKPFTWRVPVREHPDLFTSLDGVNVAED